MCRCCVAIVVVLIERRIDNSPRGLRRLSGYVMWSGLSPSGVDSIDRCTMSSVTSLVDTRVRLAAFQWLDEQTRVHAEVIGFSPRQRFGTRSETFRDSSGSRSSGRSTIGWRPTQ